MRMNHIRLDLLLLTVIKRADTNHKEKTDYVRYFSIHILKIVKCNYLYDLYKRIVRISLQVAYGC